MKKKIGIIGGGILGLSIAYRLLEKRNEFNVHVFEKESDVGIHQSGRNSGVLHCGLNYTPNSLKANLATQGIREMTSFCTKYNIEHEICGKIVVATADNQIPILDNLAKRGRLNGLKGLKFLNSSELKNREPYVKAKKALLVPEEGIVNYKMVMLKMVSLIKGYDGKIHLNSNINSIEEIKNQILIGLNDKELMFDLIINCSGLHSDRVFKKLTGKKRPVRIIPFRGEYMSLKDEYKEVVNNLVYPVPDPNYPFLGVHFTRLVNGSREVGPNAVLALKREGYKNTDFNFNDMLDSLLYPGFFNFIKDNFSFSVGEFHSSLSSNAFLKKAQKLIPEIKSYMLEKGGAGVRAQAMSREGKLIMDFNIEKLNNQIHILNAPSPGATSSIAIADYIIKKFIN